MKSLRTISLLFIAAALTVTACDEFPEEPDAQGEARVTIEPVNWPAYLRLQEQASLEVQVLDEQGRVVVDPPLRWTNASGGALSWTETGVLERSAAGAGLGWATVQLTVEGHPFRTTTVRDSIPVVLAGVSMAAPTQDTAVTSIEDTVALAGFGASFTGGAVAGTNLQWRRGGSGAVEIVGATAGDQISVVARQEGTDTVYVSHPACQGVCEQFVLVTVAQAADTVGMTPGQDTVVAEDTVRMTATARDARRFPVGSEVFTWTSSNPAVATVDASGLVTAQGMGTAGIIAVARSGAADTTTMEVLESGVIEVQLTDAPADLLSAATVYIGGAYVLDTRSSQGRRYLTGAFSRDLLTLSDTVADLGAVRVPTAGYGQVYLQIDSARVTLRSPNVFADSTTTRAFIPEVDTVAAAIDNMATVLANDTITVVVDMSVDASFPMPEPEGGVIASIAFEPQARAVVKSAAASLAGTLGTTGTAATDSVTLRAVRTDIPGDTLFTRTRIDGTYTFRYMVGGSYTVTIPQAAACHVASPASISQTLMAGQALTGQNFSLDPVAVDSVVAAVAADTVNAIGYTASLSAVAYSGGAAQPGLSIDWSTLNPAVATVNRDGVVTGVAAGTAGIVASSCGRSDTVSVLVRQVPASVAVSPPSAELEAGTVQQFTGELFDSAAVRIDGATFAWSSSDTTRATIDATGLATAVRSGTVTITATHSSGVWGTATLGIAIASVETVSLSGTVGCVLTQSGEVLCWGQNPHGATGEPGNTGDWNTFTRPTTVNLPTGHTWVDVAAGQMHACALNSTGDIYCWGHGNSGEIGHGSYSTVDATPTLVYESTPLNFTSVSAAQQYTCATTDTYEAYCWGNGTSGRLGTGSTASTNVPTKVFQLAGVNFAQIAAGDAGHTCALSSTGLAYCWGANWYGQLGNNSYTESSSPVSVVMPSGVTFTQIVVSERTSCALGTDGGVYCWGRNDQLIVRGGGALTDYLTPQRVGTETFTSIGIANQAVCGTKVDGTVMCSGNNHFAVMGNGLSSTTSAQWQPGASGVGIAALDGGAWDTMCGIATTGEAYCWGNKGLGLLGTGQTYRTREPMKVALTDVIAADRSSWSMACSLTGDNKLWCWENILPVTGYVDWEANQKVASPVQIALPTGKVYTNVGVGSDFVCVLTSDGDVYCLGENYRGQLGDGTFNSSTTNWVKAVAPTGVTFTSLTTGLQHSCAMGSDGAPYCWGANEEGRLGIGNTADAGAPAAVLIPTGVTFADVQAAYTHTCAPATNGAVYCWGGNQSGELGTGTTGSGSSVPTQVQTTIALSKVAVGGYTSCALAADGAAYCWGAGDQGQLGNNARSNSSTPVLVAGLHAFDRLYLAGNLSCGVKLDGSAMCWGTNWDGQMGNGTSNQELTPVAAYTGLQVAKLFGFYATSHVITTSGELWSAGSHERGDTGVGLRSFELLPVRVGGAGGGS